MNGHIASIERINLRLMMSVTIVLFIVGLLGIFGGVILSLIGHGEC
ncbi:MAG: hypothetical protein WA981_09150 [Glaciecola sp.]